MSTPGRANRPAITQQQPVEETTQRRNSKGISASKVVSALDGGISGSGGLHGAGYICPAGDIDGHKVEYRILLVTGNQIDVIGRGLLDKLHNTFSTTASVFTRVFPVTMADQPVAKAVGQTEILIIFITRTVAGPLRVGGITFEILEWVENLLLPLHLTMKAELCIDV